MFFLDGNIHRQQTLKEQASPRKSEQKIEKENSKQIRCWIYFSNTWLVNISATASLQLDCREENSRLPRAPNQITTRNM